MCCLLCIVYMSDPYGSECSISLFVPAAGRCAPHAGQEAGGAGAQRRCAGRGHTGSRFGGSGVLEGSPVCGAGTGAELLPGCVQRFCAGLVLWERRMCPGDVRGSCTLALEHLASPAASVAARGRADVWCREHSTRVGAQLNGVS